MDSKWRLPDEDKGFEDLCCLIAQEKYRDPNAQQYGRPGQKQFGVDILAFDHTKTPAQKVVIQCKYKKHPREFTFALAKKELLAELEAAFKGQQQFEKFVYASNIENDTHLQDFASQLTKQQGITVIIWSIADIKLAIEAFENLRKIYTVSHTSGVEIQQKLNTPPVNPMVLIGRDDELNEIHTALHSRDPSSGRNNNLLLLVNGEGGIGKTTLAAAYYHKHADQYQHLAWVYADDGIADALLTLENSLHLSINPQMTPEQRFEHLLAVLANLKPYCLLVIDNANALNELENNYAALCRLSNFHILITSRVSQFADVKQHAVALLSEDEAKTLFCRYYPGHDSNDDQLLIAVFIAVGYNTLVIELLAKNLHELNQFDTQYDLTQLLDDLDKQGLTQLSKSELVKTPYQAQGQGIRTATPEAVITSMYKIANLNHAEQQLIAAFAVLPAEPIAYRQIKTVLVKFENLDKTLKALQQQGWLDFNNQDKTFKCSPVVQSVVRKVMRMQTTDDRYQTLLIYQLAYLLEHEAGSGHLINSGYQDAALYARFAENLLKWLEVPSHSAAVLYDRTGRYYQTVGDLTKALVFYHGDLQFAEKLLNSDPSNPDHKNNLAISYQKLGYSYSTKGDLDKALEFYLLYTKLAEQLHQDHPQQIGFKNGLAVSYSKLGETFSAKGELDKALEFYLLFTQFLEQLHQDHPQLIGFKNGLAISYEKLGCSYSAKGDLDKALKFFQLRREFSEQLYQDHPQNIGFKNGLAISYEKLGETYSAKGDLDKALEFYEKDAKLSEQLHLDHPQHIGFKNGLAVSLSKLGQYYQTQDNDKNRAKDYFVQAQQLWQEINRDCPGYAQYQQFLEWVNDVLANLENPNNDD